MDKVKGPLVFEVDGAVDPAAAPLPVDIPQGRAMVTLAGVAGRPASALSRWFWRFLSGTLVFGLSLWAWNFVTALVAQNPLLGAVAAVLLGGLVLVTLAIAAKELAGFARLRRLDRMRDAADRAIALGDPKAAREVTDQLMTLYSGRGELALGRERVERLIEGAVDGEALLALAERELVVPLDALAVREIEAAARQVATVTAVVPLAFADVAAALIGNVRMIRAIAEVYGGRAGTFGSLRLVRSVLAHLVATGAVAVGDDLIGSLAGGGLLSKLSRRFGEGVINGALTARVGVAALEVCRPLPFRISKRPSVSALVGRALKGLFG